MSILIKSIEVKEFAKNNNSNLTPHFVGNEIFEVAGWTVPSLQKSKKGQAMVKKEIINKLKDLELAIEALQIEQEDEPKFYDENDYWNGRASTRGRLIDADVLIEDFNKLNEWLDIDEEAEIVSLINNAPTVQVDQPQGKWEYCEHEIANHVDGYKCSHCGFFVSWDYMHESIYFIEDYNFCPSCGADMREEK